MTNKSKRYIPDDLIDFMQDEQERFIRYLDIAYEQRKITRSYYMFALEQDCYADDWEGAISHFEDMYRTFIEQNERYEYFRLVERAEKGEQYLSSLDVSDPLYAEGEALYEQICEQLQHY